MELGKQIKNCRQEENLSQEELAERVYVSRQTISNWENDKSYPDVNSLVLLSEVFHISLDKLIKGDIDRMREEIKKEEVTKLNHYSNIYAVLFIIMLVSAVPLVHWLDWWGFLPLGIIFAVTLYFALKAEKVKKDNDIQSYKEVVAFLEGKRLDEIQKQREIGKRPYQKVLAALAGAVVALVVCGLMGLLMKVL